MTFSSRKQFTRRWPFWLLVVAWFCANSPQRLTYEIVVWTAEARHFSHQERLAAEVAFLLAGEKAPELLATVKQASRPPFTLPVATPTVKKIELGFERAMETPRPLARELRFSDADSADRARRSSEPLLEPPRVS